MKKTNANSEEKIIQDLKQKIVQLPYSENVSSKKSEDKFSRAEEKKLLELARRIRETYDYNDTALHGA